MNDEAPRDPLPDTIAALATSPGRSALAVIRISGPRAHAILRALAPGLDRLPDPGRTRLTRLEEPGTGRTLDRAVVVRYRAPASYTGEDLVEISTHGGWMAPATVLDACVDLGAREAEPGEFTRRAYLNGKLDLVQAEAVMDVVESRSRGLHGAAIHQLERGLSGRIARVREELVRLEALLVHHIDFPEEDEPPVPVEEVVARAESLGSDLGRLLATAPEGELLREGALTVLAGRPNAGKSSLYNALVGEERAIVTEVPGTTRDALETVVSLGGYPFRLVDTAGLREADERVERLGIEVARRYLDRADLVLLCVDGTVGWGTEEQAFLQAHDGAPVVVVLTKADKMPMAGLREGAGRGPAGRTRGEERDGQGAGAEGTLQETRRRAWDAGVREILVVSAVTGEGLDRVRAVLPGLLFRGLVESGTEVPVLTRKRQVREARRALVELDAFAGALRGGVPAEVASAHIREAETALEALLGVISPEEVLDQLFREFCIGK